MTALPIERAERAERAGRAGRTRPADPSAPRTAGGLGIVEHAADKLGRLAPPVADLLGFEIRALAPGEVTFAMQPSLEHYNPIGMVHGGIAATLLDTVMGCAVHTLLPAGVGYSTLDISVRYLRPITVDTQTVVATGTVVHHGRRTATAEGRIVAADTGRLLATATSTLLVIGR
jgi:uncharacterized protein (TIGR00369 family)